MFEGLPSRERPLILGILVDVSGSMLSAMGGGTGGQNRLEAFRDSLKRNAAKVDQLSQGALSEVSQSTLLFAYGFGFGGPGAFLSPGPDVRDLLQTSRGRASTISLHDLALNWDLWEAHLTKLAVGMFGNTPMLEGLTTATERLRAEIQQHQLFGPPIIFFLSDGDPTDGSETDVTSAADVLRSLGAIIVSCYVTDSNITEPRRLYEHAPDSWPSSARLMLNCASTIPSLSPIEEYLRSRRWHIEPGARLFAQVNQSEILSEFMGIITSPVATNAASVSRGANRSISVFITYSHHDRAYLAEDSLYGFLKGLTREGFSIWFDTRLEAGALWDNEIKKQMEAADIVIALVSQSFLNSDYCQSVEMARFLERRKETGLVILPIIVAPCDWRSYPWLSATQFEPRDGRTIEPDYEDRGKRDRLFLTILERLRALGRIIRASAG
ncbi:hypothetical protein CVM73_17555 [Bradyrhizobium forestalis]|uniref:TIR domain-containing protein n=1 Tax=Bradyrhizobium forestalis TaxID=1419263 RepID=A0A2M8R7R4_9BRAD|nr:TIR domain-containing protein [Bradyrhizobium forestalis]PJG53866.1 hypothetical protein CVM73_17555 [Bradyrhizobium forestalis]